ncbi:hypothetical protein C2W63_03747 [Bacillus velezensis]|nr:hypothetical protein C2W63_03747 [Bacillus velezensis]
MFSRVSITSSFNCCKAGPRIKQNRPAVKLLKYISQPKFS